MSQHHQSTHNLEGFNMFNYQLWYIQNFENQVFQNYRIVCQTVLELTHAVNILNDKVSKVAETQQSGADNAVRQQADPYGKSVSCSFCHETFNEH